MSVRPDASETTRQGRQLAPLIVIVGPTAVGKTALSLRLAESLNGEIISADSRQVYRGMDIGTAKATPEERERVPHHLIDVVDPAATLTLAQYQEMAYAAINDVLARGRLPILVGGTGQYVRAVVEGWSVPKVPPQEPLRQVLDRLSLEELQRWLGVLDPRAARSIDQRNRRRMIRALEVTLVTGQPISEQQRKSPPPYRVLQVGLLLLRTFLYRRIDDRVDRMVEQGLLEETRRLVDRYGSDIPAMSSLGYAQLVAYLRGATTLDEAIGAIKHETRRFVRHQANWFKPEDPAIHWFDVSDPEQAAAALERFIHHWLAHSITN